MISAGWRKRWSIWQQRLYLYPAPEGMPRTPLFWLAMGLVTLAVVLFCTYFVSYLATRHDVFLTNAEDLGIMDQAIWNTLHGQPLHQTVCNIVSDTNCFNEDGIMRFSIHFEPILFPIAWLYALWPSPKMLLVLQTVIAGIGAFPAFWLARLRLRNELASVGIALLYLLYPALQQAVVFDFHAVTLTAAFLLFTLYFMYTRQTVWIFVFAFLSIICKEEISLVIVTFGLWSMVFQRRWWSGGGLAVLGVVWFVLVFYVVMPHFSPTGHPLLEGRYGDLGKGPVQVILNIVLHPKFILQQYIFEPSRAFYLRVLVSPAGYLPILAPWILVMALPSVALNLLSSQGGMHTGLFQYNAEIVPVLIFATIEAIVLILWLVQQCFAWWKRRLAKGEAELTIEHRRGGSARWSFPRLVHLAILAFMLIFALGYALRVNYGFHGNLPYSISFVWPASTPHSEFAQHFIDMIPPAASVSAQSKLVPHLSQRASIYMFPYGDEVADYILLDVSGDIYPYFNSLDYAREAKSVLMSGQYGVVAAQEGYLLLKRGLPPPPASPIVSEPPGSLDPAFAVLSLPESFCSNVYVAPTDVAHPLNAAFQSDDDSDITFLGFSTSASLAPKTFSRSGGYMSITTFWQITQPISKPLQIMLLIQDNSGKEYIATTDVPELLWCPVNAWKPGAIVQMTSSVFNLRESGIPNGLVNMSVALLPQTSSSSTIMDVRARLPLREIEEQGSATFSQENKALQLLQLNIVN